MVERGRRAAAGARALGAETGGFAIQVTALLALSRTVGGMLVPGKDAWYLAVPLILISVFNATMARRVAGPCGCYRGFSGRVGLGNEVSSSGRPA